MKAAKKTRRKTEVQVLEQATKNLLSALKKDMLSKEGRIDHEKLRKDGHGERLFQTLNYQSEEQDILNELPNLAADERRQIMERLCELQDKELVEGPALTAEEMTLLDRELDEYRRDPGAGSSWEEVERRLLSRQAR